MFKSYINIKVLGGALSIGQIAAGPGKRLKRENARVYRAVKSVGGIVVGGVVAVTG